MAKPIIAVDIDDVLASEVQAIIAFTNKNYGTSLEFTDFQKPGPFWGYWEQVWGVDKAEGQRRIKEFLEAGYIGNLQLINGASETIKKLEQSYQLVVVTSRDDVVIEETHTWLSKHFPKLFKEVAFVKVWSGDRKASKATICKQIGADYLIDDSPEHCALAAEEGITSLLFGEYGWNKHQKLPKGVKRVKDWPAIAEYFHV